MQIQGHSAGVVNPTTVRGRIIASLFYSRCLRELRMLPSSPTTTCSDKSVGQLSGCCEQIVLVWLI
jgi:hypothetical protein